MNRRRAITRRQQVLTSGEAQLIRWLTEQFDASAVQSDAVDLAVGDDMAILKSATDRVLLTTDLLLDGVHFDRAIHQPAAIGRKAIACSLSDCAAMAVQPIAANVSLALPKEWRFEDSKDLFNGMRAIADEFACSIVGGDITGWDQRLAIDVAMLGAPYPSRPPVRRDRAKVGDVLFVTGKLGGSIMGRHMTFTPRVAEAKQIVEAWDAAVHAMMDISDGLALDLHRMCAASGVGAMLEESMLEQVISPEAHQASARDGATPLHHALTDGEDYELLVAVDPTIAGEHLERVNLHRIGEITESKVSLRRIDGQLQPVAPQGFEHLR